MHARTCMYPSQCRKIEFVWTASSDRLKHFWLASAQSPVFPSCPYLLCFIYNEWLPPTGTQGPRQGAIGVRVRTEMREGQRWKRSNTTETRNRFLGGATPVGQASSLGPSHLSQKVQTLGSLELSVPARRRPRARRRKGRSGISEACSRAHSNVTALQMAAGRTHLQRFKQDACWRDQPIASLVLWSM